MTAQGARRYSDRLGTIANAQLQQACDTFDLGLLESAEPASAGLWGQNILLSTTAGEFVLRGHPQPPHQFAKERAVAAAINARSSLPVPWPYHLSNDTELFGWPYAILPHLTGTMGSTLWDMADDTAKVELAAAHGAALAELHQARFDGPGPYDPQQGAFVRIADYRAWTLDRIELLRTRCHDIDALTPDDQRYIDRTIESCADALTEPLTAMLVHHDFSLANTNYELIDRHYRATGVFDLGEAHLGDGEEDLVRFLFRRRRDQRVAFIKAYTAQHPFRAGAGDRVTLYALADLLFMWEVSQRTTHWFADASFVGTAQPTLDRARNAVDSG